MIRGVIFDYGGTIDSRGEHWSEIIWRGWQNAGIDASKELFRECYVFAEREMATDHIIEPEDNFYHTLYKKVLSELYRYNDLVVADALPHLALGCAQLRNAAEKIAHYCDDYARECIAEARPSLEALAARLPMVLVSNFYGNIDAVLREYDLRQYFQGIIESSVVGVRKPDPRIFMLGVVALGFEPSETVVIGDSLKKDILPAESIGCQTLWIKGKGWTDDEDAATHPSQVKNLEKATEAILTAVN